VRELSEDRIVQAAWRTEHRPVAAAERRARGLITVSAGNHAQAVAWAASVVEAPCTVVMPADAPQSKLDAVRGYGAKVVLHDDRATLFDRMREEEARTGATFVHPFDDPSGSRAPAPWASRSPSRCPMPNASSWRLAVAG
jgi:hypothetical protein